MGFWLACLGILAFSCQNTSRDSWFWIVTPDHSSFPYKLHFPVSQSVTVLDLCMSYRKLHCTMTTNVPYPKYSVLVLPIDSHPVHFNLFCLQLISHSLLFCHRLLLFFAHRRSMAVSECYHHFLSSCFFLNCQLNRTKSIRSLKWPWYSDSAIHWEW